MAPALISQYSLRTLSARKQLSRALEIPGAADGRLQVRPGAEPDCSVIGATSEAHLDEVIDRLKREFRIEASVGRPKSRTANQ